jgi:hypothetical protein
VLFGSNLAVVRGKSRGRGSLAFPAVALYIPFMTEVFRFARLHQDDLAVCVLAGMLSFFGCRGLDFPRTSREKVGAA